MAKKALCIGINNYPGTSNDLLGCINDANDWRAALEGYGFSVQQLLDSQATKDAMYQAIQRLVQAARVGDVIVITYSGHGSWIPDLDNDEPDARDEVLCPYDISQNRPLTDDELYSIFMERARGVHIAFISDSCHSGSVTRMASIPVEAAGQRIRFLPPEQFLPDDAIQVARERALRPAAGAPRPFGNLLLSGCQDTEYSYDAEFAGRPNGAFTYFALKALTTLPAGATYRKWHQAIRTYLPNPIQPQNPNLQGTRAQKAWKIFGGSLRYMEEPMSTQEKKTDSRKTAMGSAPSERSRSPWMPPSPQDQRGRPSSRAMADASSIYPDGSYVVATGSSNTLFRIQNGQRHLVPPTDIESLGITQGDIQEVDSLELHSIPVAERRQRAIGRDLQRYLWSDLKAGHYMQSWVWLQGTTLTVRTRTETVTWFGGYTGGVSVVLFDAGGNRIQHDQIRYRYGVDGRAFSSGWREDTETVGLPQNVADAAESIVILHYWDPKVDLVGNAIIIARIIWELIQIIAEAQRQGEPVNAGGAEF